MDDLDRVRRGSDATVLGVPDEPTTTVLEAMPVGYLSLDADWRISYVNAEGQRMAGAARQDLLGYSFWMAFPATVGTVFKDSYRRARAEQSTSPRASGPTRPATSLPAGCSGSRTSPSRSTRHRPSRSWRAPSPRTASRARLQRRRGRRPGPR